jgi:5,10-methylenetetrahydromethanopterin reductase
MTSGGTNGVRFGLRLPPCVNAAEVASFARSAEDAGFDHAWFPDSQFLWRDVWATVALAAARTERIVLGTAVTNFETRNTAVTAAAAATLEELAPRRFVLGVGTGDSSIKTLGLAPTRLARMREQIELVRQLLAGEAVAYAGAGGAYANRRMRLRSAPGYPIPIYLAATGPKALALAGEIADGVIMLSGTAPHLIEDALGHVRRGAEAVGRELGALDVCLAAHTALAADEETAARLVKPLCITSAQLGGSDALKAAGIEVRVPPVVAGVYPDVTHAEDWNEAIEAADRWVTDEMSRRYADAFCLAGPPQAVADRLRRASELGVTSFYVLGLSSYVLPGQLLEEFRDRIIPQVRGSPAVGGRSAVKERR